MSYLETLEVQLAETFNPKLEAGSADSKANAVSGSVGED
jgi:hypothetical protein